MTTVDALQNLPAGAYGQGDCGERRVARTACLQDPTGPDEEVVHSPHPAVGVHYTGPVIPRPHPCRTLKRKMRQK